MTGRKVVIAAADVAIVRLVRKAQTAGGVLES
jgi:hypothetical protein